MKKVLILAAHPDDEVLGCGGFIAKYNPQGYEFHVFILGEGSTCRFSSADTEADGVRKAIFARQRAAGGVKRLLKIDHMTFGELPCGRLDQVPIIEINKIIEQQISSFKPDIIFTHADTDANNDHRVIYRATIIATRPSALNFVPEVMCYETLSSTEWAFGEPFVPTVFEELEESHVELKCEALSIYETEIKEFPFPRSRTGIQTCAMNRGMQAGSKFAEAYKLVRSIRK